MEHFRINWWGWRGVKECGDYLDAILCFFIAIDLIAELVTATTTKESRDLQKEGKENITP